MSGRAAPPPAAPLLLLMDSPRKKNGQLRKSDGDEDDDNGHDQGLRPPAPVREVPTVQPSASVAAVATKAIPTMATATAAGVGAALTASSDSLGRLLVEMTAQVQDERSRRSDIEKRNQGLMLEIEALQQEILELKTSREQRRRASDAGISSGSPSSSSAMGDALSSSTTTPTPRDETAEFWWRELQETKHARDRALADSHQRALQVLELNACVSMQHDELKALRVSERELRDALAAGDERAKDLLQQNTIVLQESRLLKDEVAHLQGELGQRGVHFKALMDKWTEAQAQGEHLERENRAMLEKMREMRQRQEQLQQELERAAEDRELLQHQVNHLKGAVAAKSAEARAFQAYGSNARDHLQAQHGVLQRHQIYRRRIHTLACAATGLTHSIRATLASIRAPLVGIQADFRLFLKNLQTPVLTLVTRARRYAEVAHLEHQPLREACLHAELARRHLHEQLWRSRRNAMLVCQVRTTPTGATPVENGGHHGAGGGGRTDPESTTATAMATAPPLGLRVNFGTGELLYRETERESIAVQLDAIVSDRARGWSHAESLTPVLQSVLDGYNACVATVTGLPSLITTAGATASQVQAPEPQSVAEVILTELFQVLRRHGPQFHRVKLTISFLAVYNETIFDLLGLDASGTSPAASPPLHKLVVLEVQDADEALLVLRGGRENLATMAAPRLTHQVITVCVHHDDLLIRGGRPTKSKLQIVELAALDGGSDSNHAISGSTSEADPDASRREVKAHVAMENGLDALLVTLSDVRLPDAAFVRYHSSKLTVLLQDTIKPTAKFLGLVALPAGAVSSTSAHVARWLQRLRLALGGGTNAESGGGGSSSSSSRARVGLLDRTVEGFINRYGATGGGRQIAGDGTTTITATTTPAALTAFSSADLEDSARQTAAALHGVDGRDWDRSLDAMGRRYGDLEVFTTSFFSMAAAATGIATRSSGDSPDDELLPLRSPRRSLTVVNPGGLTDVVIRPHELVPIDGHGDDHRGNGSLGLDDRNGLLASVVGRGGPQSASISKRGHHTSSRRSRATRGVTNAGSSNGSSTSNGRSGRLGGHATTTGGARRLGGRKSSPEPMLASATSTLAPTVARRVTSMVKLRRETASSALKRAAAAAVAVRSPGASSRSHHARSTIAGGPHRSIGSRGASHPPRTGSMPSTMAATAAARKVPFK